MFASSLPVIVEPLDGRKQKLRDLFNENQLNPGFAEQFIRAGFDTIHSLQVVKIDEKILDDIQSENGTKWAYGHKMQILALVTKLYNDAVTAASSAGLARSTGMLTNIPVRHFDNDKVLAMFRGSNSTFRQYALPFHDDHGVAHVRCRLCSNTYTVQFGGLARNNLKVASFVSHFARTHPELWKPLDKLDTDDDVTVDELPSADGDDAASHLKRRVHDAALEEHIEQQMKRAREADDS
eukprot:TRINITY_DN14607_c0_g1_i1.p1 TRINITY_DN14607_c0_g1~~TRINITY_DN14607_c0_g1_i1.p1  ORF type:complete len:238 (+),score=47.40 TRINITY_DN14607_c0_g1_i1:202-915(+)